MNSSTLLYNLNFSLHLSFQFLFVALRHAPTLKITTIVSDQVYEFEWIIYRILIPPVNSTDDGFVLQQMF